MSADLANPNVTTGTLIDFTFVTFAELMPGTADGKMIVTLAYAEFTFFSLSGTVQLWLYDPTTPNSYRYAGREYEINFFSGNTFTFHGLSAGKYVAVYWDDGGTRGGAGVPEISQVITLLDVFPAGIPSMFSMSSIPINAYDTNYKRSNRNFISYALTGPLGFRTILNNACTDPRYNRCFVWEERTDQGNVKNIKTYLDPHYPGGLDTMFQYKTFPIMCCDRYTRIIVRITYSGANAFFPTKYEDYWDQRQTYGYGTELVSKILRLGLTYYDETFGCGNPTACIYHIVYQRLVTANWPNTSFPACVKDSAVLNTLTSLDAGTDLFMTNTLRRNYCECFAGSPCGDPTLDPRCARAFRAGSQSYTNNYDKFEDWFPLSQDDGTASNPYWGTHTDTIFGDVFGRPFSLDFSFSPHTNAVNDAYDYPCNPTNTRYVNTQLFNSNGLIGGSTGQTVNSAGVFVDLSIGKKAIQDFYSWDGLYGSGKYSADPCVTSGAGSFSACSNSYGEIASTVYSGTIDSPLQLSESRGILQLRRFLRGICE